MELRESGSVEVPELQRGLGYSFDQDHSSHSNASRESSQSNRVLINNSTLPQSTRRFGVSHAAALVSGLQSTNQTLLAWKRSRSRTLLVLYFIFGFVTAALLWASLVFPTWAIIRIGEEHEARSNIFLGVSSDVPLIAYLTGLDRTAVRFCPGSPPLCASYIWWWWDAPTWARAIESYKNSQTMGEESTTGDPHAILGEHSTSLQTSWLAFNAVVELSGCIAILPYVIVLTTLFATLSVIAILVQSRQEADEEAAEIEREAVAAVYRDGTLVNSNAAMPGVDESQTPRGVASASINPSPNSQWTRRRLLRSIASMATTRPLPGMCGRGQSSGTETTTSTSSSSPSSINSISSIGLSRLRWPEGLLIAAACGAVFVAAFIALGHVYNEDFWASVYNNMEIEFIHDVYAEEPTVSATDDYRSVSLEYARGIRFFLAATIINVAIAVIALI